MIRSSQVGHSNLEREAADKGRVSKTHERRGRSCRHRSCGQNKQTSANQRRLHPAARAASPYAACLLSHNQLISSPLSASQRAPPLPSLRAVARLTKVNTRVAPRLPLSLQRPPIRSHPLRQKALQVRSRVKALEESWGERRGSCRRRRCGWGGHDCRTAGREVGGRKKYTWAKFFEEELFSLLPSSLFAPQRGSM